MSAPDQVVWKFMLQLTDEPQPLSLPAGARLVHADWFQGRPTLWYLVEADQPRTTRRFQIAATGQTMPPYDRALYHGTVIQNDMFVWHIFELLGGDHPMGPTPAMDQP